MVAYSFKRRFVPLIFIGLGRDLIELPAGFRVAAGLPMKPKMHTIRANGLRRHARRGETLQLYYAQRTKQCFKIGNAECDRVRNIAIRLGENADMEIGIEGCTLHAGAAEEFAESDGFASLEDMWLFWRENHPKIARFEGAIVDWKS